MSLSGNSIYRGFVQEEWVLLAPRAQASPIAIKMLASNLTIAKGEKRKRGEQTKDQREGNKNKKTQVKLRKISCLNTWSRTSNLKNKLKL